ATTLRRTGPRRSPRPSPTSWSATSSSSSAAAIRRCSHERPQAMKAALFNIVPYLGEVERGTWPAPARGYSPEVARRSMELALEQYQLADELGFDWVTLAEHHFAPLSLTPNPMVMAGAVTQRVRRAR